MSASRSPLFVGRRPPGRSRRTGRCPMRRRSGPWRAVGPTVWPPLSRGMGQGLGWGLGMGPPLKHDQGIGGRGSSGKALEQSRFIRHSTRGTLGHWGWGRGRGKAFKLSTYMRHSTLLGTIRSRLVRTTTVSATAPGSSEEGQSNLPGVPTTLLAA